MLAGSADFPVTIDEVTTSVRHQRILVEDTMGSGDATGAATRLAAAAGKLSFPAYVALVSAPSDDTGADPSGYLATALRRRIATPGIYVVAASGPVRVQVSAPGVDPVGFDHDLQANLASIADRAHTRAHDLPPEVEAEAALLTAAAPGSGRLSSAEVARLATRAHGPSTAAATATDLTDNTGLRWFLRLFAGLLAMLVVQRLVRGWPGWRRPRLRATALDRDTLRSDASAAAGRLAERLPSAAPGPRADEAMLAREAAEALLRSDLPSDLIGALVLSRTGNHALDVRTGVYHCCFLNPLHGAATTSVAWRLGEGSVEVPSCSECSERLAHARVPDVLTVVREGETSGYYEGDDVWARTGYGSLVDDLARQVTLAHSLDSSAR